MSDQQKSTGSATGESRYRCIKSASDVGYGNGSAGFLARPEFQSPGHKRLFQPTDPDEVEICRLNQPRRHIFEGTSGVGRGNFKCALVILSGLKEVPESQWWTCSSIALYILYMAFTCQVVRPPRPPHAHSPPNVSKPTKLR